MPITINGSGTITGISAGGLPDAIITTAEVADANITPAKLSQKLTSGTAVASTSGTSIDFTSIPSWVKRITIQFDQVSTSAASFYQIQLGTSGGVQTTGYACVHSYNGNGAANGGFTATTGFAFYNDTITDTYTGQIVLSLLNSATVLWVASGWFGMSRGFTMFTNGSKALSGTLDRVRITTVAGTPIFDAGSINILYE